MPLKSIYDSPLGPILLEADEKGLTRLVFQKDSAVEGARPKSETNEFLTEAKRELDEYFAGKRREFHVALSLPRGTPFQRRVWQALQTVPYGQTCSYQEEAKRAGSPKAVRAVAQANKANPIAIIIPCHRVIGKSGKLTGYMGACTKGLALKKALLELEQAGGMAENHGK